jgi:hypothetical protein
MKLLSTLLRKSAGWRKQQKRKTLEDYRQELLVRQGREQFKKLVDKGLQVPVVLL